MFYNRTESYRHSFGKPAEIFIEMVYGNNIHFPCYGLLLDVSPRGAKIFTEKDIFEEDSSFTGVFKINHEKIEAQANMVWKTPITGGYLIGVQWTKNQIRESLIADELESCIEIR
ncbi:PilZ domain-containing protein [Planococcus sp. 1R117A]|uniref:PilZ domain-containing protein n=1 Tax=Planococcus sp. 1R117A TaxID=3447020 RepID=UPI003EDC18F9